VQIRHQYDHGEVDEGATPDAVINDMTELLKILQVEINNSTGSCTPETSQNQLRALLFDAGDVLYYRQNSGDNLAAFLNEIGLPNKEFSLDKRTALRDKAYQGLITYDQYQNTILRFYGITRPNEIARGKEILDKDANDVMFFDGVPETLCSLKAEGYLLGIVTDTALPVHVKLNWFERGGFGHVWDSVVSSRELGTRKPNPKIYQVALQQLGVTPGQTVFIGHKGSELNGAKAVGITTIAFNYEKGAEADIYLDHFSSLLKIQQLFKYTKEQG
jgi:FMN phosphatase YigB (HAD superfamily)